jgi:uncharacterized protein (TIRG00374 family)
VKRSLLVGIPISVVCGWLAFRNVDYAAVATALREANYLWLFPVVGFSFLSYWIRAVRWQVMLDPIKRVPIAGLFSATMIGFLGNNLFPARLGELLRAVAVGRKQRISKSSAFATIVVERAFDMFALLTFLGIVLLLSHVPRFVRVTGFLCFAIVVAMFAILVLFQRRRRLAVRILSFFTRHLPRKLSDRADRLLHSFIDGLGVLTRGGHTLRVAMLSLVHWFVVALTFEFCLLAFGITHGPGGVPLHASLTILVIVSLGLMIPSSPAFVGTFQAFTVAAFATMGVDKSRALSYSLVYHAGQFLPVTLVGFYFLWRDGLSLRDAARPGMGEV